MSRRTIKQSRENKNRLGQKELFHYKCGWCGNEFDQKVGHFNGVSSQVKCKRCGNFIPTFNKKKKKS